MLPRLHWRPWWRTHLAPSPIPKAAAETNRIAAEVAKVAQQLRRMNDYREANPR
jgi:hypothetical protein